MKNNQCNPMQPNATPLHFFYLYISLSYKDNVGHEECIGGNAYAYAYAHAHASRKTVATPCTPCIYKKSAKDTQDYAVQPPCNRLHIGLHKGAQP